MASPLKYAKRSKPPWQGVALDEQQLVWMHLEKAITKASDRILSECMSGCVGAAQGRSAWRRRDWHLHKSRRVGTPPPFPADLGDGAGTSTSSTADPLKTACGQIESLKLDDTQAPSPPVGDNGALNPKVLQYLGPADFNEFATVAGQAPVPAVGDVGIPSPMSSPMLTMPFSKDMVDTLRISVWRGNDWHPVTAAKDRQIKEHLRNGESVFEVSDGGTKWTVDTTGKDGWVQVGAMGKTRKLKYEETLEPRASPMQNRPKTSWPLSFWVKDAGTAESPPFISAATPSRQRSLSLINTRREDVRTSYEERSLIQMLRREWYQMSKDRWWMTGEEVLQAWSRRMGKNTRRDTELLEGALNDVLRKAALSRVDRIEEVEWIHFRLLEAQAPSYHALEQVNEKLRQCITADPVILQDLMRLFEMATDNKEGEAWLTAGQMRAAAKKWIRDQSGLVSMVSCSVKQEALDSLANSLQENTAWEEDEVVTYYDFMNHMLGRRKAKVQIYLYDLSRGRAAYLSPWFLGRNLEGIWHSGVVVHQKEYWYGGCIFESSPGKTPFGEPTKIIDMPDHTMRTRGDLWNFIRRDLVKEFTSDNYDVLTRNCNHFSDSVCGFLLNQRLPDAILRQPDMLMDTWAAQLMRPLLNRALGRFGSAEGETSGDSAGTTLPGSARAEREATDEWSKIALGSLVSYEYETGWTCVARVIRKDEHFCDLKWMDVSVGKMGIKLYVKRGAILPYSHSAIPVHI